MQFWQVVSWCETEHMVAVAEHAEALGFTGLILAEHLYYPLQPRSPYPYSEDGSSPQHAGMEFADPLITFAACASVTQKLQFMTGIYLLALRHPIEAAKNMATLARLSGDRFSLGIGAGWLKDEFETFGVDFARRGARLDITVDLLRELWTGQPVSHHGEFFDFDQVQIRPYPRQPIPIIGGGCSGAALRRSALRCDGWYGPGHTLADLQPVLQTIRQQRADAGLGMDGYRLMAPLLEPLTADSCQRLAALGVEATVAYPFTFGIGPDSTLDQKLRYMEQFANTVIRPCQGLA